MIQIRYQNQSVFYVSVYNKKLLNVNWEMGGLLLVGGCCFEFLFLLFRSRVCMILRLRFLIKLEKVFVFFFLFFFFSFWVVVVVGLTNTHFLDLLFVSKLAQCLSNGTLPRFLLPFFFFSHSLFPFKYPFKIFSHFILNLEREI